MRFLYNTFVFSFLLISCQALASVRLFNLFQNNMVLQRDKPCAIWGWSEKGETVMLYFNNQSFNTKADTGGRWKIILPAQPAGGPFTIKVSAGNTITLNNVLFGDVWFCGGQSNMQIPVSTTSYQVDSLKDNNSNIRIFKVRMATDFIPLDTLGGGSWKLASPQTVPEFPATPYFFGKHLQEALHVPIGLISDNLGSTPIETWMSPAMLKTFPQFGAYYHAHLASGKSMAQISEEFESVRPDWEKNYYLKDDPGFVQKWYLPQTSVSGWKWMKVPGYWEDNGLPGYDGSVWFRRTFDLKKIWSPTGTYLFLGTVDDYHIIWVNGHKIGGNFGNQVFSTYLIPDSLLRPKENVVVVRVFDAGGKGGMYDFGWHQELAGAWRYKPGARIQAPEFHRPVVTNVNFYDAPSLLYNGSIAPLTPLSIKGIIWYQGEANAGRAEEYKELFPALIWDWRKQFGQGDVPFLYVQIANYGKEPAKPAKSDWAELREAQSDALALPNTAMTVAIDIGDANDLHPKKKAELGRRMGITALKHFYNKKAVDLSPMYDHMEVRGDSILLFFRNVTTNPLTTGDKHGYIRGFSIAGADQIFHWAKASIVDSNAVVVYNKKIRRPVAVRYGWADNPGRLDLYNTAGWPAAPFRTDNWPMHTAGKKYVMRADD